MRPILVVLVAFACAVSLSAQDGPSDVARRQSFDELLDQYVRDGLVYYRALKQERARLEGFAASLADASVDAASQAQQMAFWLNAYNALVLKTVVEHYPIPQQTPAYPPHSIRQIPGAFEQLKHRVAGRSLTLDQIEQTVLSNFHDPRVFLAIGRGAVGGGRLRSEAFTADKLEAQLTEAAAECTTRSQCFAIDSDGGSVSVSSIFSWRSQDFVATYGTSAPNAFADRSPIERAVLALVSPRLMASERAFLEQNKFKVMFRPFDWTLNDLTGRGGR